MVDWTWASLPKLHRMEALRLLLYKYLGPELNLPRGSGEMYGIYISGAPGVAIREIPDKGLGRIAHQEGTQIFYYSPYHYRPGPGVPNAWIRITLSPQKGRG